MSFTPLTQHTRTALFGVFIFICAAAASGCQAETNNGSSTDAAITDAQNTEDSETIEADTNTGTICDTYCATAAEVCTDANSLYPDAASCQSACAKMRQGKAGAPTGNTVQCRIFHLELGRADPAHHCPHASESGADKCINPNEALCRSYCGTVMENCLNSDGLFPSADACLDACFTIPNTGTAADESGDSVQCRITHADAASTDPTTHCPAAAVTDSTLCTTP